MANVEMSMYDIHKQLYPTKTEPLDADKLKTKMASIGSWFSTNPMQNRYGLLCREKYDFTVFEFHNMNYNRGMELVRYLRIAVRLWIFAMSMKPMLMSVGLSMTMK